MSETSPQPKEIAVVKNRRGIPVMRYRFLSPEDLERWFIEELVGSEDMDGCASKVVGTTLLIWDRRAAKAAS